MRAFPCFCDYCLAERFTRCKNQYAGKLSRRTIRRKGTRQPKARYHDSTVEEEAEQQYVAEEVLGDRVFEGRYQYLVKWVGYDDTTWHDADTLQCIEMIEEYECGK